MEVESLAKRALMPLNRTLMNPIVLVEYLRYSNAI